MMTLRGIVLAAGEGRRMGGAKALLRLEGQTLVEHHVARLLEVGCTAIAVVVRPETAALVSALLGDLPGAHVEAVSTRSQAESLAAGLAALEATGDPREEVIVVTPVDMMPAALATHHVLLASLTGATLAVTPRYAGRGGHPVIARRPLLAAYEARAHTLPPLRVVLEKAGDLRRRVEVVDRRVLGDLDTPSDLLALQTGT